ncbi:SpoIIIAH-like family protein [Bacillus niameyensis]|uniref:SpoIIIAH-like family protein n=1 Tax=Bacillus niameyensis TaxID=1522308 RepID=UPI000781AB8F|nr:SpoIIIAH-like family protein [Bacillus niameyensis]
MLLKKQTVWLLTMLSLVVVLSVYYVTFDPASNDLATGGKEETESAGKQMSDDDMKIITEASGDEVYEAIRLDIEEKRGKMVEELTSKVAATESTDEQNKLYDEMQTINELSMKERTIENTIKGLGYSDALVKIEDNVVNITVKQKEEEHTAAEATTIIQAVRDDISTQYIPEITFDDKK